MTADPALRITSAGAWLAASGPLIGFTCGILWEMSDSVSLVLWVFSMGAVAFWSARLLGYLLDERRTPLQRVGTTSAMAAIICCAVVLGAFTPFAAGWGERSVDAYGGYHRSWDSTLFERLFVALVLGAVFGAGTALASHGATMLLARQRR